MSFKITQVDAFTNRPFTGNPAGVCILAEPEPDWWMQDVAREMNVSETAFLIPHEEGYDLRWFTPVTEVDLCGHATLASAHVLWEDRHLPLEETARFHTRSGLLLADRREDWIELDFPAKPVTESPAPEQLAEAMGIEPAWIGRSDSDLLVQVDDEKQVRTLRPDFGLLRRIDVRGVI
ncbi:MAG: PhzF family phenazine biosynthesis protein, partial [Gemmatimonadetes bacterium]|nr:PhzF family phenazine biosynthesis protein [Gemmatimonadota bacterium]